MARAGHPRVDLEDEPSDRITADWSQLPPELLHLISRSLTNVADYARFRCVCAPWRSASPAADLPPQLPWLLLPFVCDDTAELPFLNLSDSTVYTIHLPEARRSQIYGSPHGWLVVLGAAERPTASLLNPLTGAHIFLPLLRPQWRSPFIEKVVLSANPALSPARQVLVAIWVYQKVVFCTLGDDEWTVMDMSVRYTMGDFVFHDGVFYCADRQGRVVARELGSSKKIVVNLPLPLNAPYSDLYLVESSGDLLMIAHACIGLQMRFVAFKLDKSGHQPGWVTIEGICDTAFFLSRKQSVCIRSAASANGSGCNGGSIYYAVDNYMEDSRMGTFARVAIISESGLDGANMHERPYFWQAPRERWTDWKDISGITWIIPNIC